MIVNREGKFVSQRTSPRLARIAAELTPTRLRLSSQGNGYIEIGLSGRESFERTVEIWQSPRLRAVDAGDEVARWLSKLLGEEFRLVRTGPNFVRPVKAPHDAEGERIAFTDAFPFLVIGESSLADLNRRLVQANESPVPMNRFRPNLVVRDSVAFEEDTWRRFRIGEVNFRKGGACARCIVTTTDQSTGDRGPEPLRTLAHYRRDPLNATQVNFGQNFLHEIKTGLLRVGDPVQVLS